MTAPAEQIDTFFRLGLAELQDAFARPQERRRLNADEARALIDAWAWGVRSGDASLGTCWAYLGWTPEELEHFEVTGRTPDEG